MRETDELGMFDANKKMIANLIFDGSYGYQS